ncbi:MAG: short-chain fatty acyl-CoA regulator family protein [Paracoccus sp. (in: a-proteobacteria)]|uniref:short-chain fatty acyl-CoA regulator family protein n=1 Tax=Paracoccus sp. TaxID=267 RepID=UPI0026E07BAF|nr:short-chain fatty acyl-CoA regulator family protein [Paracoccus sp. (in: a-proteobacteria)]MDO5632517.1 short-chain fatty acyl-CoA regulator family protein [Paracoccus sp. (in: a-proteobacteria)]
MTMRSTAAHPATGSGLTGTRIRERRLSLSRRQADVARAAGISAAYLNLIEHNRRPVSPDLIARLAQALDVPPEELASGREEARIAALREAAARQPATPAEVDQAAEFLARFPGWAAVLTGLSQRAGVMERRLIHMSDRMSHDPYLPAALHEVLSAVTSLRASASILAEGGDLPDEWGARFRANLQEDSNRLSATVQAVAAHLDTFEAEGATFTPTEEVEAWMAAGMPPVGDSADLASDAARAMARAHLADQGRDREALPDAAVIAALDDGADLPALAVALDCPPDLVMRRLVALRPPGFAQAGLLVCDGAGALVLRRPPPGFPLARLGDHCAVLPIYQALAQPHVILRVIVDTPEGQRFDTYSYARRSQPHGLDGPVLTRAQMLILPVSAAVPAGPVIGIGPTCRICPRGTCPARREPSILAPI